MNVIKAIEIIKNKFIKQGKEQRIPKSEVAFSIQY
jgi:hypothetical protein